MIALFQGSADAYQWAIYFAPMNGLYNAMFIVNIALCTVFALIQILRAWRRTSFIGCIGCIIGLHIIMVAPLISYILRDGHNNLFIIYSLRTVINITLVSSIPIAILLGVTVISNLRHRNNASHGNETNI